MHQWTLNWTQIKILFPDAFTEKINEMQATLFKKNALFLSTNKNLKVQDSFLFLLVSIENSWSNSCLERSSFFPRHILHSAWPQSQGTLPFFAKQFGLTSQYSYWTFSILFLNRKVNVDDRRTSKAYLSWPFPLRKLQKRRLKMITVQSQKRDMTSSYPHSTWCNS